MVPIALSFFYSSSFVREESCLWHLHSHFINFSATLLLCLLQRLALTAKSTISQYCTSYNERSHETEADRLFVKVLCADTRSAPIVAKSHTSLFSFLQWNRLSWWIIMMCRWWPPVSCLWMVTWLQQGCSWTPAVICAALAKSSAMGNDLAKGAQPDIWKKMDCPGKIQFRVKKLRHYLNFSDIFFIFHQPRSHWSDASELRVFPLQTSRADK